MINEKKMTLATDYDGRNPTGWRVQEKLDGCRAYWDGRCFWTRGGKPIRVPQWLRRGLPKMHLDGEIWAGRRGFELARRAVQYNEWDSKIHTFQVFDAPKAEGDWVDRSLEACEAIGFCEHAAFVDWSTCQNIRELLHELLRTLHGGGEGLMIRNPHAPYEIGRSKNLLKVKAVHPAMFL